MDAKKAMNIVAAQCSKKELCSSDIQKKLERWEISENDISQIMEFLYENKFVDDLRFAKAYARDKFTFKKWGKIKISQMLRGKNISSNIISMALEELPDDKIQDTCMYILMQKNKSVKEPDYMKRKAKLYRFALSRGFSSDIVLSCIDKILKD